MCSAVLLRRPDIRARALMLSLCGMYLSMSPASGVAWRGASRSARRWHSCPTVPEYGERYGSPCRQEMAMVACARPSASFHAGLHDTLAGSVRIPDSGNADMGAPRDLAADLLMSLLPWQPKSGSLCERVLRGSTYLTSQIVWPFVIPLQRSAWKQNQGALITVYAGKR